MTTFAERLDALPGRPKLPIQHETNLETNLEPYRTNKILWHITDDRDALEARLRLAVELLEEVAQADGWALRVLQTEEVELRPDLRDDIRALVAKVKGELL